MFYWFPVIVKCVLLLVSSYNKMHVLLLVSLYSKTVLWLSHDWFPHTTKMWTFTGFLMQVEMYTFFFSFFQDSFCTLIHLVKVDLSKNKLTELPVDFGQLENLQHLDLLGNQLTTLPESFSLLNKLKWLDLKDNPLDTGLKKNAGDCLDEKQCRACAQRVMQLIIMMNCYGYLRVLLVSLYMGT